MRTVRDASGTRYVVLEDDAERALVREPETGETRYLEREALEPVDDVPPLAAAAAALPEPVRRLVLAVPDERALGLVVELDRRGPTSARELLDSTDLCESDLHGRLAELRAAGVVVETTVAGEAGYELTDDGRAALDVLRSTSE